MATTLVQTNQLEPMLAKIEQETEGKDREVVLQNMMTALVEGEHVEEALRVARRIPNLAEKDRALALIAITIAHACLRWEVGTVISSISDQNLRNHTLAEIIKIRWRH